MICPVQQSVFAARPRALQPFPPQTPQREGQHARDIFSPERQVSSERGGDVGSWQGGGNCSQGRLEFAMVTRQQLLAMV